MDNKNFELLLAMMRLLKNEDRAGSSPESIMSSVLDNFNESLNEMQRKVVSEEFIRYEKRLQKKNVEKAQLKQMEEESYKELMHDFVEENFGW